MEEYFYEIDLSWKSEKAGFLTSHGVDEIKVFSPMERPGGKKNQWTPEQLLGASVSSCFMTTFLEIAEKNNLEVVSYQSQCFVKLEKKTDKYTTEEILIRPIVKLKNSASYLLAQKCLEEAETACPSRKALKININVHPIIEYQNQPSEKPER
jgi:organic hydroperoxide reductase OsmC/OhrA